MAEFVIEDYYGLRIEIDKVGGGTVGKSYAGRWEYLIRKGLDIQTGEYESGMPETHMDAALAVGDILIQDEE